MRIGTTNALLVCIRGERMETIYLDLNTPNETVLYYISLGYDIVFIIFE